MNEKPVGLAVFDLDGTILRGATSCEVLARVLGREAQMRRFEALTEESNIIMARNEMAFWYQTVSRPELIRSLESTVLAPNVQEGFALLQSHSIELAIASITWSFVVDHFADRFSIQHRVGTDLADTGEILHFWPRDKGNWVRDLAASLCVSIEKTAAVGDSKGDIEMLKAVRHPVFVGETIPATLGPVTHFPNGDVLQIAEWIVRALK
jgi:HAD superfamily phosphoserine phosphatase-like hydrolase